jgi:hypothetical protein
MDPKRRKRVKPSSEVSADGPQAPKTGKTVVWGASGWTSEDGMREKKFPERMEKGD